METKPTRASRKENFDIETPEVQIEIISGKVEVLESTDGQSHVEVSTRIENSEDLRDLVNISTQGKRILIRAGRRNPGLRQFFGTRSHAFDITVLLSKSSMVKINAVSAEVYVDQTLLNLDVQSVSGDVVVLQNPTKICSIKTVSGDITAHANSISSFRLKSVSGDMKVTVAPGLEVDIDGKSISGDLKSEIALSSSIESQGESGECVTINASSVSGDISLGRS